MTTCRPADLRGVLDNDPREPHLRQRIRTTIGLLCGWQYNWHSIRAICEYTGVGPDRIVDVSYRGDGPIGKLRIVTDDGRETTTSRRHDFGAQVAFDRSFNTPRCHLCINHSNFLAVVGDAWLASTLSTKIGISLVINRREESDKLVRSMADAGRVIYSEVTVNEIRESQKPRIAFGDFAYAYASYRDDLGLPRPMIDGPNKSSARPVDRRDVEVFHRDLGRKLAQQRARRYRYLFWRKATKEFGGYVARYWNWFTHWFLGVGRDPNAARVARRDTTTRFR